MRYRRRRKLEIGALAPEPTSMNGSLRGWELQTIHFRQGGGLTMSDEKKLPALPITLEGWDEIRKPAAQPRLVDEVERVFRAAIANPEYNGQLVALLEATNNKNAREGSLGADRIKASDICRAQANEIKATLVSEAKLQIIANKLSSVLRRYQGASRVERQKLAG